MKVITITASALPSRLLTIGYVGENERTQVRIDCTAILTEYPYASPTLAIKPPVGAVYPVVVSREDNDVVWDVSNADLQNEGDGELQLTFIKDGVVAKTVIGKLRISRSLLVTGEKPDVIQTWYDAATEKLAEVDAQIVELEDMVDTATDAATRAEQSESNATTAAANAATSAATATAKATEATTAATTATAKAAEAALSATQASNSAVSAADSESGAIQKAAEAAQSAQTATAKAGQATEAAQTATGKAGEASASATAAQASATDAASSATAAQASQTAAKASETAAGASATQAAQSAQTANTASQTATQKAAEATQSATGAAQSAQTATTNAEEAAASAQAASDAQAAVEEFAEQLADSLEQIDQNTQDIAELDERKANIDGYYQDMTVGDAEQLISSKYVENSEPYTFRTSGGSSDIGNREYLDAVVGGTVAWNQAVRDEASENSTDFAPIVTVTDAVEDAAGMKVKIEPVQDLHGYDHPWPAGGGKNLLDSRIETSGYIRGTDGAFVSGVDAWKCSTDYSPILPNTNYILYKYETATSSVAGYAIYDENKNYIDGNAYSSGATISITTPQNARYIRASWGRNASTPVALMRATETDTSFSPYANICPITGWDGVKVSRTGKNLCYKAVKGYVSPSPNYALFSTVSGTSLIFECKAGVQYVVSGVVSNRAVYGVFSEEPASGQTTTVFKNLVSLKPFTTASDGVCVIYINSDTVDTSAAMVELGSTATDYEPYAGQTYSITLPTEAGTVYGGELTVNADGSGSLVVDRAEVDLGTLSWGLQTSHRFQAYNVIYAKPTGSYDVANNCFCSEYATRTQNQVYSGVAGVAIHGLTGRSIYVWDSRFDDAATFKSAMSGVQLVYELATPITYTLTASQIRTLLGENNVWADTGDLALTYTGTDEHLTLESGKKYLARLSGTDSMLLGSGQEITAVKGTDNVFDLTQMFGTSVADYVYGQGASFFRKWFGKQWYPYNAGELLSIEGLQSHDTVGFNQFDKDTMVVDRCYIDTDGTVHESANYKSTDFIPVVGGMSYYINTEQKQGGWGAWYDGNKNYAGPIAYFVGTPLQTAPQNACYMRLTIATSTSGNPDTLCINLSHNASRNGEYQPYEKHSYPLDSSVILRGIPKVGANGVYWDGDRYLPDGTVERKYGVVDLGTLNWTYVPNSAINFRSYENLGAKPAASAVSVPNAICSALQVIDYTSLSQGIDGVTVIFAQSAQAGRIWACNTSYTDAASFKAAMSGVMLVYELAEPTTETAQPYHSTQWVSDWGTEEFVSTGIVPVGHETRYPQNLRDKLQHLPSLAGLDGKYIISQSGTDMTLVPYESGLPTVPSANGSYVLKCTVTNGVASYSWVAS